MNISLSSILKNKGISPEFFLQNQPVEFSKSISENAEKVFDIYKIPYPNGEHKLIHGISHVSRVALYIPVLYKMFKRYQPEINLDDEDLKLLQLAALLHDSAREGEGDDLWEHDSATIFYFYLTKALNISKEKAKLFSEAIVNKDYINGEKYYSIKDATDEEITWETEEFSQKDKSIIEKLLHDADCLDIIRARDQFDGSYLDFYQDLVKDEEKQLEEDYNIPRSMCEIGRLICEARGLIELCGDTRYFPLENARKNFNVKDCYSKLESTVKNSRKQEFPLMSFIMDFNENLSESEVNHLSGVTYMQPEDSFDAIRGIAYPSQMIDTHSMEQCRQKTGGMIPTNLNFEISHDFMRKDVGNGTQDGNGLRSVSQIGLGSGAFASSGFLIKSLDYRNIQRVYVDGNVYSHDVDQEVFKFTPCPVIN